MLNFFKKDNSKTMRRALTRTQNSMLGQITQIFNSTNINQNTYEDLEDILIGSDIGTNTAHIILTELQTRINNLRSSNNDVLLETLKDILKEILLPMPGLWLDNDDQNLVILILGVNGAGKTTSLSKLANLYKLQNKTLK